ncbi:MULTISPECIES: alpha/beta hydrolase [unclassified Sphingobacterium]|uniref:alpha/beta hydrolase n=1 Tax=unclassified Sphingobacterium TaxID=2609468 RepID=UPI0025E0FEAF|nr:MULTISPECIES: alpha/beta hydrolase [unclassified Sphingobacterium]
MKHSTLLAVFLLLFQGILLAQYDLKKDVAYYPEAKGKTAEYERCKLDFYYPVDKKDFATILWFHGGGLTGGQKEIPEYLKNRGMAVVGVGYRLSPQANVEGIIEDAAAAIAWVFNHIEEYGGSRRLVFVSGHSAGGYLGMMTILDKHYLQKYTIDADQIAGLIPFSGQAITHFTSRQEHGIAEKQPTIDRFAPLFHVRQDAPPILLITGDRELEMLGRYEENAYLARMLKITGHKDVRLLELQGFGHNMQYPAYPLLIKEVEERTKKILQK